MVIYEHPQWHHFTWEADKLVEPLARVRHRQGRLIGQMDGLGFQLKTEATLAVLTQEVVKSSAIEGEHLDTDQVRSSIARRLGMDIGALTPADRDVEGVVEMMLDATRGFDKPLTVERLFGWHGALFPTGRSGLSKITVGAWRTDAQGPMQVVSGPVGRERIHCEAPPASALEREMKGFLDWLNEEDSLDPVFKAGLAHLWFVTIHPFEDGNGRIARAITDMLLARADETAQRFYSMSAQIQRGRNDYYAVLERTQSGTLDVTEWLLWFFQCLDHAIDQADTALSSVLYKADMWKMLAGQPLNERQHLVINRLLDGFEGKLTTSKWAKLAKCSQDTAYRDILDLVDRSLLSKNPGGGRSTSYSLTGKEL